MTFPLVSKVGNQAFVGNHKLEYVTFGTGFTEETEIEFGINVFSRNNDFTHTTNNITLTLGEQVLPIPNVAKNT